MTYCQSITQTLRIIWVKCIPLSLKSKTESNTSASYLDLLLSIESDGQLCTSLYDKRDAFNIHITNFPFLGSNIPSSSVYGILSHSSCGMPGLALLMNVLFKGRCDFHLSPSERDMSWNVWNRPSGSFMVDMGISSSIMKYFSQVLHDILGHGQLQWHPQLIRHCTNLRTYYRTRLYYQFWPYNQIFEVTIEHCNGCA